MVWGCSLKASGKQLCITHPELACGLSVGTDVVQLEVRRHGRHWGVPEDPELPGVTSRQDVLQLLGRQRPQTSREAR